MNRVFVTSDGRRIPMFTSGSRLRSIREQLGFSIEHVASFYAGGVCTNRIREIESLQVVDNRTRKNFYQAINFATTKGRR